MWCVMLTRIGLFILQQFLHIGCLRIVIANGPTHSLKGDSAGPEVTIHLQNYSLFWRILLKPDLAIGACSGVFCSSLILPLARPIWMAA